MTIVLLLVLVWAIALAPVVWRKLIDIQVISEVARFNHRIGTLRRVAPVTADQGTRLVRGSAVGVSPRHARADKACSEGYRRALKARADRRLARRRRLLAWLGGSVATTLVFGVVPGLHFLWDLTIVATALTVAYLGLLAWSRHEELLVAERAHKVVELPSWVPAESASRDQQIAASSSGAAMILTRRPAFVLVDAPS